MKCKSIQFASNLYHESQRPISLYFRLQKLPTLNADMNKKFLKFVGQCLVSVTNNYRSILIAINLSIPHNSQNFEDESMEMVKIGRIIPQPQINLAFENGRICYWNGK